MNDSLIYGKRQEYLGRMYSLRGGPGKSARDHRWRKISSDQGEREKSRRKPCHKTKGRECFKKREGSVVLNATKRSRKGLKKCLGF